MKPKQISLIPSARSDFGGSLMKSNAKSKRPLHTKNSIHLVLKSHFAVGRHSLLAPKHLQQVERIVRSQATNCAVKIYHFVNVGNHLHIVIKIKNRALYSQFVRAITGLIARLVTGRERSKAKIIESSKLSSSPTKIKFWQARPFSRVITWGREFKAITNYMIKNRIESQQIQKCFKPSIDQLLEAKNRVKNIFLESIGSQNEVIANAFGFDHLIPI